MKNKLLQLFILLFSVISGFIYAGPPSPGGGGTSGDADQVEDTPIDMFVIPLAILAIVFIIMYSVKVSKERSFK